MQSSVKCLQRYFNTRIIETGSNSLSGDLQIVFDISEDLSHNVIIGFELFHNVDIIVFDDVGIIGFLNNESNYWNWHLKLLGYCIFPHYDQSKSLTRSLH